MNPVPVEVGKSLKNVVAVKDYMINKGAPQPGKTDGGAPFNLPKGENPAFFLCRNALPLHMGNHTAPTRKSRHRLFLRPF